MLMTQLLPGFKEFCTREILSRDFDFIVPIETKGMLILEEILRPPFNRDPRIRFRRAFDFIPQEELASKSAAFVDDTVVLGRTLHKSDVELRERGMERTSKYAFILYDLPRYMKHRQVKDVSFCSICAVAYVSAGNWCCVLRDVIWKATLWSQYEPTENLG